MLHTSCIVVMLVILHQQSTSAALSFVHDQSNSQQISPDETPNFLLSKVQSDGEQITWVHWRGRWGRQIEMHSDHPDANHLGLIKLIQVTNGQVLVHNIYDSVDGALIDCDVIRDVDRVRAFIDEFQSESIPLIAEIDIQVNGTTFQYLDLRRARTEPLLQYGHYKHECRIRHQQQATAHRERDQTTVHSRPKRSLLISPGTQWCGSGSTARHAYDLGENAPLDRCCRDHDTCPYVIEGFTSRYGYFNYRFYTMSFCECDRKFYSCLKRQTSGQANLVGRIFFNVVNTSCFELERERMCTKHSFWGACNKWRTGLQAKVVPHKPY